MKCRSLLAFAAFAAVATPSLATTLPATVSLPASQTGVSATEVRLFASRFTFYDPAGRAEPTNDPNNAVGAPDGVLVSLGDLTSSELAEGRSPGVIIVEFESSVFDGPGADLVVFENASNFGFFVDPFTFAELAFVEVSTNGADFARFPAISRNVLPDATTDPDAANELQAPFGLDFAGVNTTFIRNLAGVHGPVGGVPFGTPFDLAEIATDPLVTTGVVDLEDIRFVRIVDIPGSGEFLDSEGNPIFDTQVSLSFPTLQGFDLDAVGAINFVPEPSAIGLLLAGVAFVGRRRR